jgi:biotin transport system substrate-specific component
LVSLALFVLVGWLGAPVFAGGASGFGLPTTGYVLGYVAAAGLVGYCAERGLDRSPLRLFGVVAAASAVIYLFGLPCLALMTGLSWSQAVVQGLLPFLLGDLLKAAAAAGLFPALWRLVGLIAPGARGEG